MADGYMQVDLPKCCRVCERHSGDGLACLAADHHVIRETEWFDKRPEWCPIIPADDVRPVAWISVDDRLPEIGQTVLAYSPECEEFAVLTLVEDDDEAVENPAAWQVTDDDWRNIDEYQYWMPLPDAPKEADRDA